MTASVDRLAARRPAGSAATLVLSRLRELALFLVIVTAPFLWVPLASFASLSLKPVHISLSLVFLVALLGSRTRNWRALLSGDGFLFLALYSLYLFWYLVTLLWAGDPLGGAIGVGKNAFYFVCFIALALTVAPVVRRGRFVQVAGVSSLIGLVLLVLFMATIFALNGYNLLGEYWRALTTANADRLQRFFYPTLFRLSMGAAGLTSDLTTSLRNTVMGGVLLQALLLMIWFEQLRNRLMKLTALGGAGLAILLIVLSVSRSNTIALAVSLALPYGIRWWQKVRHHIRREMAAAVAGMPLLAALVGYIVWRGRSALVIFSALAQRFAALTQDPRLVMYNNALSAIEARPVFGYGFGKEVLDSVGTPQRVHNVFLVSWLEMGLVGLVLALAWYAVLGVRLLDGIFGRIAWRASIPKEWATAFLVLPLFRVQESGGGTFTLMEWIALAIYWGAWVAARTTPPDEQGANQAP